MSSPEGDITEEERKGSSLSGLKSDEVRFAGRFACGKDGGGGGGGGGGGRGGGVEDLEEVDGFGDACGFGDVCGCGEVGVVGAVGVTGFGHDACEYLLLRSLELARVSLSGARKPSNFQTPEPLLISTPCALICRKMTVGMVAIIMCVCLVW